MLGLMWEVRYGLRKLLRQPGFTLAAVLTLGLGCGVTFAVFAVLEAVLLAPLPYPDGDRLVALWESQQGGERGSVAPAELDAWRRGESGIETFAAYTYDLPNLTGVDTPEALLTLRTSASFLDVLGVEPLLGRGFRPEEGEAGATPVVLLGHGLWRRAFAGREDILGQKILLDGLSHTVIGVMPAGFEFPLVEELPGQRVAAWIPLTLGPAEWADRGDHSLEVIGRLAPGVTLGQARERVEGLARRFAAERPGEEHGAGLAPLKEVVVGPLRGALGVLFGAVCCVLLIACANVGNLMLVRALSRERQTAVRFALGGSRLSVAREWLLESLLVALFGAGLGLVLARGALALFRALQPARLPRIDGVGVDSTVLLFAVGIALMAGLATAFAAIFQLGRSDLSETIREGGRGALGAGAARRLWRDGLVVVEMALATVLAVAAALLIKSFLTLSAVDPGFDSRGVLTSWLLLPDSRYSEPARIRLFFDELFTELEALPGVEAAGGVSHLPLTASRSGSGVATADGDPVRLTAELRIASPGYFPALGIRPREGRLFDRGDGPESDRVAVINPVLATRLFPGASPLGRRVTLDAAPGESFRVVGVVGAIRHAGLDAAPEPEIYLPHAQVPSPLLVLTVKAAVPPATLAEELRQTVLTLDPEQPIFHLRSMEEIRATSTAEPRLRSALLGLFAGLAFALAAVGIYGVVACTLAERTREFALRLALGAERRQIEGMVLRSGLKLALAGVGVGLVAAAALVHLVASLLYGVGPFDPLVFAGVAILLVVTALAASYLPARRAGKIAPHAALVSPG